MKYKDWLSTWLEVYVKPVMKEKTYSAYANIVRLHIIPSLGEYELEDLGPLLVQQFVTKKLTFGNLKTGKGLSVNTVNSIIAVIQGSLETAYLLGKSSKYEMNKIKRPKNQEKSIACFTKEEQKTIERAVMTDKRNKMKGIVLCLYTGLRIGELLALEWTDVDFQKAELNIRQIADSQYEVPRIHPALIMCTSGTTGKPKGVMLSEENILTNVHDIASYFTIDRNDAILIARPLYHCAVLTGEFLTALIKGVKIQFYSGAFHPSRLLELVKEYGITALCGTPTLIGMVAMLQRAEEPCTLKHICISGECMDKETGMRIQRAFPKSSIYHVYGLTEASPRVSYLPPHLFAENADSVGVPLASVDVKVRKDNGDDASVGEEGVLWIKGDNVMLGYYRDRQKTKAVLRNGWLCTGDLAVLDANGLLRIKGRRDDLIIKAGMNIYPAEIEAALKADARVREVLAYGYQTRHGVQIGVKIVCDLSSPEEVKKMCMERLPAFAVPTRIDMVDALPKNGSGKLIRGAKHAGV